MIGNDELDLPAALDEEPREVQAGLVEWEEVSPRCWALPPLRDLIMKTAFGETGM